MLDFSKEFKYGGGEFVFHIILDKGSCLYTTAIEMLRSHVNAFYTFMVAQIAEQNGNIDCGKVKNSGKLMQQNELDKIFDECCMKHGICSHEVLRDRGSDSSSNVDRSKMMRKASFKLSWWCKGENGDQHKHDIVSFEKGNITTAERSSKQISLKWESDPQTVLILTKPNSVSVRILCAQMVRCGY
ncbi:hypothetical protein Goklo_010354 [Gossypium klotzschianum]|uniref:Uncharacterized protein n=1 Tax=Gossypium klotzschianum TaxID=34286 RepID=A0A7J8V684_9ROSI|nr:hypothetical protein [Gossypium klotzschianum]